MNTQATDNSFRDFIATVDDKGKRVWIYPKEPQGDYYKWRKLLSYVQMLVLFGLPFLTINGHPAILLNVLERKFVFFGHVFWPSDFYLFALCLITVFVFIILFTSLFGRVWCGWLCPQTVFLEMIFRRIERWIEGDARQQKKLNEQPMDGKKFTKKFFKHSIFYGFSFVIGNVFLAYIIGVKELWQIITDPPQEHIVGLVAMLIFSFIFYGVFSWFREQACLMVCPYGRWQSVLQDQSTMMVSYDYVRGEPRSKGAKRKKQAPAQQPAGDCIDCGQCISVCPTGIDIRNGIQLECVNCTACMDACNTVMDKIGKPRGLIRFASQEMIEKRSKFRPSKRSYAYAILLVFLLSINTWLFAVRPNAHAIFTRVPGSLCQEMGPERYANIYRLQLLNKTFEPQAYQLKVLNHPQAGVELGEKQIMVKPESLANKTVLLSLPKESVTTKNTPLEIGVFQGEKLIQKFTTSFLGP